ncbi:cytochrome o ubiquinol oxidase subunit IV [Pseudomonas citronellolis]|uniref:cytochrome o ubiquinol oxidase subunit IV n=1 Tax=Pseudomonas citronellolis TaxID=53408 RepID=UPI0020A09895|nr:cytochrome o ubiquinol oxidase subunit IV [Pseudomonas citronellolis]MCP1644914.1 cytochrome o ubiquinol oxidase subunit IV [Pseudomonas citronellolis]MCP1667859.1 cytochrome o ubiquinol oxidase subunit IV [Pseudomonas citronellolis]MCP1699045.1 cytochrome o ubiquinol oxidase subunit IV [Pseudomonas citronellolis]MCP1704966.1 cytochrome o ubiquinol oxidase subunit IV [Pseudomonas citronellolis]MCP1799608.1 cytochrome o ubiquinol oxidase subunit IV [Pseudomonas citronellolis]
MSAAVHDSHGAGHGSLGSYAIGFVLSVILTAIPFAMVMTGSASRSAILVAIVVLAVMQILVHLKCFLHLNLTTPQGSQDVLAFIFTLVVILLLVGLSVWIIFSADLLMMPMTH